jgi:hypothetical protein
MQLSVWQNRSLVFKIAGLAFKILRFQKNTSLNHNFLKTQFSNDSFSTIWFNIALFVYFPNPKRTPRMILHLFPFII